MNRLFLPGSTLGPYLLVRTCLPLIAVIVLSLLAAGCSLLSLDSEAQSEAETEEPSILANDSLMAASPIESKPTISLGVTDWTAAQANGVIAEKLIERRLGYPVNLVEVVDIESLLSDLSSGRVAAILEVWPSTLEKSEAELINSTEIARFGDLGVTAKVGWFVPRYVLDSDPALGSWEGYQSLATAKKFSTSTTGSSGRFLGTNPDYVTYDEQLLEALGVPFKVEYSGSDEATRAELRAKVSKQEPILAYWWTPTAEITEFDLVNVSLPDRNEECVEDFLAGQPLRCDYPEENLVKLGWPGLADTAPDVDQFLRNFSLTTEDQLGITHAVETEGRSLEEVTTEWIDANQERWESWL